MMSRRTALGGGRDGREGRALSPHTCFALDNITLSEVGRLDSQEVSRVMSSCDS